MEELRGEGVEVDPRLERFVCILELRRAWEGVSAMSLGTGEFGEPTISPFKAEDIFELVLELVVVRRPELLFALCDRMSVFLHKSMVSLAECTSVDIVGRRASSSINSTRRDWASEWCGSCLAIPTTVGQMLRKKFNSASAFSSSNSCRRPGASWSRALAVSETDVALAGCTRAAM